MDAHNIIGVHLYKKYTKNVFLIGWANFQNCGAKNRFQSIPLYLYLWLTVQYLLPC